MLLFLAATRRSTEALCCRRLKEIRDMLDFRTLAARSRETPCPRRENPWGMKIRTQVLLVLCGATFAARAFAQDPAPPGGSLAIYIPAELSKKVAPDYPRSALSVRREGWALVSFIITEAGQVSELMIENSSHHDFDAPT